MPIMVLDASTALSLAFEDEYSEDSRRVFASIRRGGALVPPLWPMEIANVLSSGINRKRINEPDAERFLKFLAGYPIEVASEPSPSSSTFFHLARKHKLTAYDAAYLRLAMTTRLPLAAKDGQLKEAAKKAGVKLFA